VTESQGGELYHGSMVAMLQVIWGEGFLSPGGPEEVAGLVADANLKGLSLLDIGCGAGGIDMALVRNHGAGYVTGIDVEDTVLARARELIAREHLGTRIGLAKVVPGPLPFPPSTFDVVFSKDSLVHIRDKHALMSEVYRVLKPGGRLIASDWLIGHDGVPSAAMQAYIEAEGLDFGMASAERYLDAMRSAGLVEATATSRNAWYR
jgi:ubiquinone/menaquinone biosynthesis C-methylase UbiE